MRNLFMQIKETMFITKSSKNITSLTQVAPTGSKLEKGIHEGANLKLILKIFPDFLHITGKILPIRVPCAGQKKNSLHDERG